MREQEEKSQNTRKIIFSSIVFLRLKIISNVLRHYGYVSL